MKKFFLLLAVSLFTLSGIFAQNCNPFFNYSEGTSVEHTYFNAKGKMASKQVMTVKSVKSTSAGQIMIADVTISDKKEDEMMTNEIELICENGVFKMDMSRFIPPTAQGGGMGNMEIVFEGDGMEMPQSLSVGETLKDANFVVKLESDNPAIAAVMGGGTETSVYNRKVVGKENITTSAGTFSCYKITYNTKVTTKIMGMKKVFDTSSIEWLSEGAGMVKVENYDKKGKLEGYMELTAFQNQ